VAFVLLIMPALACWMMADGAMSVQTASLSIVMIGFAAGVEYDLMAFLVARYFGMKNYSSVYGFLYGFFAVGAGVGPVVFGKAFDLTGSYRSVLLTSAVLLILGASMLLALGRYRRFDEA